MIISFNIVEYRNFDPTPAHIIITDEYKGNGKTYVIYIPRLRRNPKIRKRLTRKIVKWGIRSGICYLYPLDYVFAGDLRDGIVSKIKKYLDDRDIQLPRA